MNILLNRRSILICLTLLAAFLFLASLYFQFIEHLDPCPLCIAQRVAILFLAISYFIALFVKKILYKRLNTFFQFFFAIFGASMAGRQIWLMHTPPSEQTGCMPDISVLWHYLPFRDLVRVFFNGTASCTESTWAWWGLSMPEWSLVFFVFFIFASIGLFVIHSNK